MTSVILAFLLSLTAHAQDNSCEQALQTPLANYRTLISYALDNRLIDAQHLANLNESQLNPLGHGLNAQQMKIKAAIDGIIKNLDATLKQNAFLIVKNLIRERSTHQEIKDSANEETRWVVNPQIGFETQIPQKGPEHIEHQVFNVSREDDKEGIAVVGRAKLSYREFDINAGHNRPVFDKSNIRGDVFLSREFSATTVVKKDGKSQVFAVWSENQKVNFRNLTTDEFWQLSSEDSNLASNIQLYPSPTGELFFAIEKRDQLWVMGVLGNQGPRLTGTIPWLGSEFTPSTFNKSPQVLFTSTGEAKLFGITDDGYLMIYNMGTGRLIRRWRVPVTTHKVHAFQHVLADIENDKLVIAVSVKVWNGDERAKPFYFFHEASDQVVGSENFSEETEGLGWANVNGNLAYFVQENKSGSKLHVLRPETASVPAPSRNSSYLHRARAWVMTSSPASIVSDRSPIPLTHAQNCHAQATWTIQAGDQFLLLCIRDSTLFVHQLDYDFKILSSQKYPIPRQRFRNVSWLFDNVTDSLFMSSTDDNSLLVFEISRAGAKLVYRTENHRGLSASPLYKSQRGNVSLNLLHTQPGYDSLQVLQVTNKKEQP